MEYVRKRPFGVVARVSTITNERYGPALHVIRVTGAAEVWRLEHVEEITREQYIAGLVAHWDGIVKRAAEDLEEAKREREAFIREAHLLPLSDTETVV